MKKKGFPALYSPLLISILALPSCGHHPQQDLSFFNTLKPVKVQLAPGEVAHFTLKIPQSTPGKLHCPNKKTTLFFKKGYHVFLAESYFGPHHPYQCHWQVGEKKFPVANIRIIPKKFHSERLHVHKKRVVLSPRDAKRVQEENEFKEKIYSDYFPSPLFQSPFSLPLHSKVTSSYGTKRIFNNHKQTQHLGTDYRAAIGTPIRASNAGKVVIAREMFFSGNTIVIDHGLGIFTIYGHLSQLKVSEGMTIPKGKILGLAGQTGRVTGPHLHWGVIVNGLAVSGPSLVRASQKYFQQIP